MYIEVEPGVRLFVQDIRPEPGTETGTETGAGTGAGSSPVVFVHGWPLNHNMFEYQLNVLPQYDFRCIALDQRGFGQSDKPWHGYSYDRLADDLHEVLQQLDIRNAVLVGFSIGGAISIRYMSRYSGDRISKLVLIDAAAPLFTQRPDYPYGLPLAQVNDLIQQTAHNRPKMLEDLSLQFFNRNLGQGMLNWFVDMGLEGASYATIQQLVTLRDSDLRGDLAWIQVPTVIFHGLHDQIVPIQSGRALQQGIRGSHLYILQNSGHGSVIDQMTELNQGLLQFIR
ncbi:alpha/beta fold hydrolase [Paenibacillus lemnae]|uniref:Alpha/beta hydrolase n=1 Tax=Paenibacillus lemnae TaxID=1330551 RepID=A0A848M0V5_PAELE|nr:alpha/beta hydrolase [Paenibacillus lemnae]NMO94395.1 alpha/beta hydrolase [Paenibacillus lemnae]